MKIDHTTHRVYECRMHGAETLMHIVARDFAHAASIFREVHDEEPEYIRDIADAYMEVEPPAC